MYYIIEEKEENKIVNADKEMYIHIDDIRLLNDTVQTIKHVISTSMYLKAFHLSDEVIDLINESVIYDLDTNIIMQKLIEINFPLFSLITGYINNEKKKYKKLQNINKGNIIIKCTKDNFIKCLKYANSINNKVVILEGENISLSEYKELLSNCNLNELNKDNITICYQDTTSDISVKELYNLSLLVDEITTKINKFNLSTLEKIVYVYDFVKKREYHDCDDKRNSRDLDKVVKGEDIVCVGYSNLFNAILKSLNINCRALISTKAKHQRSVVYVKDDKYGIDGLYVFDPTWDSKKSDAYIDNYNYFAMPLKEAEKDCPTELFEKTNVSMEKLKKFYRIDIDTEKNIAYDKINALKDMFEFTSTKGFDVLNNAIALYEYCTLEEKQEAFLIYDSYIKKYNSPNIDAEKLFEAIINTRIIEYYLDEQQDINIDNIKLSISDRYSFRKKYSSNDKFDSFLRMLCCSCEILDELSEYEDKNSEKIKRKMLNIKLLKTLNNKK